MTVDQNNKKLFEELVGRPKKYMVPRGVPEEEQYEINVYSLPTSKMHLLEEMENLANNHPDDTSKILEGSTPLIAECLRINEEDVNQIPFELWQDILECIYEAMGVYRQQEKMEKNEQFKEMVKEKQKNLQNGQNKESQGESSGQE